MLDFEACGSTLFLCGGLGGAGDALRLLPLVACLLLPLPSALAQTDPFPVRVASVILPDPPEAKAHMDLGCRYVASSMAQARWFLLLRAEPGGHVWRFPPEHTYADAATGVVLPDVALTSASAYTITCEIWSLTGEHERLEHQESAQIELIAPLGLPETRGAAGVKATAASYVACGGGGGPDALHVGQSGSWYARCDDVTMHKVLWLLDGVPVQVDHDVSLSTFTRTFLVQGKHALWAHVIGPDGMQRFTVGSFVEVKPPQSPFPSPPVAQAATSTPLEDGLDWANRFTGSPASPLSSS